MKYKKSDYNLIFNYKDGINLLYNCFKAHLIELTNEEVEKYNNYDGSHINDNFFKELYEGMICPQNSSV